MIGSRFGRLVVIETMSSHNKKHLLARCVCDCGNIKTIRLSRLKSGDTKSCGCLRKEHMAKVSTRHGLSTVNGKETRLHRIWANMKDRCLLGSHFAYKNYGGRGICVCDEWLDYLSFHDWAMSNGYKSNLTIERKDNDGNYDPSNCCWVEKCQQGRNQRTTKLDGVKVKRIKEYLSVGIRRQEIADQFHVSKSHINNIASGHRWNF